MEMLTVIRKDCYVAASVARIKNNLLQSNV